MSLPATAATRHLEPREPSVIGTCAGCGGDVAVNDAVDWFARDGLVIHADLECYREYLETDHGHRLEGPADLIIGASDDDEGGD